MSKSELFDNLDNLEEIWIIWTWNKWLADMPFRYCSVFLKQLHNLSKLNFCFRVHICRASSLSKIKSTNKTQFANSYHG